MPFTIIMLFCKTTCDNTVSSRSGLLTGVQLFFGPTISVFKVKIQPPRRIPQGSSKGSRLGVANPLLCHPFLFSGPIPSPASLLNHWCTSHSIFFKPTQPRTWRNPRPLVEKGIRLRISYLQVTFIRWLSFYLIMKNCRLCPYYHSLFPGHHSHRSIATLEPQSCSSSSFLT